MTKNFEEQTFTSPVTKDGVEEFTVTGKLSTFLLFRPRGILTRIPMQPSHHNHRMLDPRVFMEEHMDEHGKMNPPLMSSLLSKDRVYAFDSGAMMGFSPYEVSSKRSVEQSSHSRVQLKDKDISFTGFISDPDLKSGFITIGGFKRLLSVIGYVWNTEKADPEPLPPQAFMTILKIMSEYPLQTNDQIEKFITDFSLDRFFKINNFLAPGRNWDLLCEMFACLQPCRLGVYDGQHREHVAIHALSDNWFPRMQVSLDPREGRMMFTEAKKKLEHLFEVGTSDAGEFQCHKTIGIKIGCTRKAETFKESMDVFRAYGVNQASAQKTMVTTSFISIIDEFSIQWSRSHYATEDITFESFWDQPFDKMKNDFRNHQYRIGQAFEQFVSDNSYESYFESGRGAFKDGIICSTMTAKNGLSPVVTVKTQHKAGVPTSLCYALLTLKNSITTTKGREVLMRLASNIVPQHKNAAMSKFAKAQVRTYDFLRHRVLYPIVAVYEWMKEVGQPEVHMLKIVESEADTELKKLIDKDGAIIDLSSWSGFKKLKGKSESDLKKISGLGHPEKFFQRAKVVLLRQLFIDVFETVGELGWDPVLSVHHFLERKDRQHYLKEKLHFNDYLRVSLLQVRLGCLKPKHNLEVLHLLLQSNF